MISPHTPPGTEVICIRKLHPAWWQRWFGLGPEHAPEPGDVCTVSEIIKAPPLITWLLSAEFGVKIVEKPRPIFRLEHFRPLHKAADESFYKQRAPVNKELADHDA